MKNPTVEQLNEIQEKWMKFDPHSSKQQKDEMFKQMSLYPTAHLSVSKDMKLANVIVSGMPMWANARPIGESIKWLLDYAHTASGVRTDVGWCGELERWVDTSKIMP